MRVLHHALSRVFPGAAARPWRARRQRWRAARQFVLRQINGNAPQNARAADHARQAQANVGNAVFAPQKRRNRKNGMFVAHNCLANAAYGHGYGIKRGPFSGNNGIGDVPHIFIKGLAHAPGQVRVAAAAIAAVFLQGHPGDGNGTPGGQFAVAVFSQYIGVNAARVHSGVLRQHKAQALAVQHRAAAQNAFGRKARLGQRRAGKRVHGIGHHQKHAGRRAPGNFPRRVLP